jgi:hypothetical protein
MRYFFRLFPFPAFLSAPAGTPISPTLQSTLCLKAGAKIYIDFYNPNITAIILQYFCSYFAVILYLPVI